MTDPKNTSQVLSDEQILEILRPMKHDMVETCTLCFYGDEWQEMRVRDAGVVTFARAILAQQSTTPAADAQVLTGSEIYDALVEHCDGNGICIEPEVIDDLSAYLARFLAQQAAPTPTAPDDVARDAERYRWLRENWQISHQWGGDVWLQYDATIPGRLDNAIDAAIAASKKGGA